ncbi:MAG: hypothetical protein OHK0021_01610 [Bryobacter sp.]
MSEVRAQMREDWNRRAEEDAHYYVAFGRHGQDEAEFLATAADVLRGLDRELKRGLPGQNPRARRALEIGCGPGRLLRPMSERFGEVHGVDVSDAMISLAQKRLWDLPHAHAHVGSGADLRQFADDSFDFIYSYAVFQHIPERDVVMSYWDEAARVLKPGGLIRWQASNLSAERSEAATWHGCNVSREDVLDFARRQGLRVLALEGVFTQYMWATLRKPGPEEAPGRPATTVRFRRVTNSESSEPVAAARGRFAALSAWVEGLAPSADLLDLELQVGGKAARLTYLGPREFDGLQQLNAVLPAGLPTGLLPVTLRWRGEALASASFRIIPAPPLVPRILEVTDGHNYLAKTRIASRTVKLFLEELAEPASLVATLNGQPAEEYSILCTDPMSPLHEVNFRLPAQLAPGPCELRVVADGRLLGITSLQVES